jgi:Bacterial Alpha-2-macroglobulin MG10 domain/Alpha-2-macroglobulin family/MG2 domain
MLLRKLMLMVLISTAVKTMAQPNKDYISNWKKVEDLEKKGLTKSAQTEVTAIYKLAQKDNNDAQQIKACMYLIKYRNMVEEDSRENNIFYVDTLIAGAKSPAKNMLQSMQAEMFWQYLQNNRWKFYDRTKLKEEKSKDITTWSIDKIHNVISKLYKSSLQNDAVLKATKLDGYDAIVIKGVNTRQLRPTLFDFLAHRALGYFVTDENNLTKPAYQFKIDDAKAFAPVAEFAAASFKTKDSASLQHKAILLLQDILKFHLNDAKPDALLDADLIRLNFVHEHSTVTNKEKLYETALKNIEEKYAENEYAAQAMYLRAKIYYDNGQQFKPYDKNATQYEIKRAKELCEGAAKKYPKSEGGINAQNLIGTITQPALSIETEKVNTIDEAFRTLVNYKNAPKVYFRIIKTNRDEIKKLDRRDYDKLWAAYMALKPVKSWSIALPDPKDYQSHSAEIKVDGLPNGTYFILASLDENFSLSKNIIAKQTIYVSNISYIHNNSQEYYVLHRDNGQPLANASVQVWESKYNYQTGTYEENKAEKLAADKNGMFKMKDTKEYRNFLLQIKNNTDELFMDDNEGYNSYDSYNETPVKPVTFLFTDRSIYRPGQTVYFKGIVLKNEKDAGKSTVVPGFITKIILRDANYQKAKDVKLITNEYGSYSGSFKLPEGILNGNFSIYDSTTNGTVNFSVEEYKRPKFSVEVEKPKGSYRVNDSIKVTGTAKAYAGNNIDGAKVKYRVVRKVQYPVWWGFYARGKFGYPYGRNDEMEITNGEAVTDAKGEFNITFKALPDESIDKKDQPTFYYEISTDVTDINGETRSGSTSVAVSYQALQLNIDMPDKLPADSLKNLLIRSTNINDIFEKATVTVSIHKVKSPDKIYRERYWQKPDQFVMSKEEYSNYFPYDIYKNEDEMQSWPLGDRAIEFTDTTSESAKFSKANTNKIASIFAAVPPSGGGGGWYKIIAITKDKYGEDVKAEKYIQLTANSQQSPVIYQPILVDVQKSTAEPGEQIKYSISTGFDNVWAIHSLSKVNSKPQTTYQTLIKGQSASSAISAGEEDRGGMSASIAFVKHNRVYTATENFEIPWSNKELNITYETFRDKLLPGANEKWTVKISGSKGEKVAAEMLAAMYDASLDQFKPHSWNTINIWPSLYDNTSWSEKGFEKVESEEFNRREANYISEKEKNYDRLGVKNSNGDIDYIGVDFGYFNGRPEGAYQMRVRGQATMAAPAMAENDAVAVAVLDSAGVQSNVSFKMSTGGKKKVIEQKEMFVNGEKIKKTEENEAPVQIRKNFNETAFFFPELKTDANGNVSFSATLPEALTQWKLMTLAHTKDLASGYTTQTITTQKPLMVQPNAPRFLREGDKMEFSAKLVNMTDKEITGTAVLELLDAATNKPVDGWFKNIFPTQYFTVAAGESFAVKFPMEVPFNFNSAMTYRIVAKTTDASDGEEMALPVLTNRMLVTESLPLNLRNQTTKAFKFDKLLNSGGSTTISNHVLTVEYTSNPAWYAVQALPYLMEYPYECAEQTFNRYYANTLATFISNSMPKIKTVFEKWKTLDTAALQSNLEKNQELKAALLQETPWVLAAQNENQQKKNIALLFDMVKMSAEQSKAINKLKEMQSSNGGFVWFKGGPDDRYITQYIITGIGHLKKLKALVNDDSREILLMVTKALPYLDKKIKEDYDNLIKYKVKLNQNNLSDIAIQYLYMRSFFSEYKIPVASQTAVTYYTAQAKKYWLQNSKYSQAMIALALHRSGDVVTPKAITKSLKENAIVKEEMGMYWKEWTTGGYYWHQAPIESQAMMIEAFSDIDKNNSTVDDLKTWLLKQKQTQNWKTTKATAEACYALLLNGSNWLSEEKEVSIQLGNSLLLTSSRGGGTDRSEEGTGYFKRTIAGNTVKPEMGNINVTIKPLNNATNTSTSWGSVYWQYFEDLDKITSAETPLKLKKQLFVERNSDKGPVLEALVDGAELKVGDKVKVRIELKVDRDMEYVHMKDMRAACMEPVNVISEYKWQGGLGYYQSTKDASTNFFFNWLSRGSYVFEYSLFVTHTGNFSNGITTIQCMYAPEFTSHSEGIRVNVE